MALLGKPEDLLKALKIIQTLGPKFGLHVNLDKCVLWWPKARSFEDFPSEIKRAPVDGIKLLGAPIGSSHFCGKFICKKTAKLARLHSLLIDLAILSKAIAYK